MDVLFIKSLLDAVPFTPFLIGTTRTGTFTITSPSAALLSTTALYVGRNPDANGVPSEVAIVPLMQIVTVKPQE